MTASGADRGRRAGAAQPAATRAAGKAGAAGRSYRPPGPAATRPAPSLPPASPARPRPAGAEPFADHRSGSDGDTGPGHRQRRQDRQRRRQRGVAPAGVDAVPGLEHRDHTADRGKRAVRTPDPGPQPPGGVRGRPADQAVARRREGPDTRTARQADQPRGSGRRPAPRPPGAHGHRAAGAAGPHVPARPRRGPAVAVCSAAPRARPLCGADTVSYPRSSEVAVAPSPRPCRAKLTLTAADGEQAAVPVTIPALPDTPVYSFAHSAGRAIYITVDDGWTPSQRVLAIMRKTRLPVTAFLIEQAAQQHLAYWRAFVRRGRHGGRPHGLPPQPHQAEPGPGHDPVGAGAAGVRALARPDPRAGPAAVRSLRPYRAGGGPPERAEILVGWSAVADSDGIHTWDDKPLEPGEIVLLHWVPGLGSQLARLLTVIRARRLNPTPLSAASFTGITPQRGSLDGD